MVINQVTANAEPNSKANVREYMVSFHLCQHLPTISGEEGLEVGHDLRVTFGPFSYVEARSFIVSAFRGGLNISTIPNRPIVTQAHGATMYVPGDNTNDYEDYIVETWQADHYIDTDCSKFEKHEAGQL